MNLSSQRYEQVQTDNAKMRDYMEFLRRERAEDLREIGELMKNSSKKTLEEVL